MMSLYGRNLYILLITIEIESISNAYQNARPNRLDRLDRLDRLGSRDAFERTISYRELLHFVFVGYETRSVGSVDDFFHYAAT